MLGRSPDSHKVEVLSAAVRLQPKHISQRLQLFSFSPKANFSQRGWILTSFRLLFFFYNFSFTTNRGSKGRDSAAIPAQLLHIHYFTRKLKCWKDCCKFQPCFNISAHNNRVHMTCITLHDDKFSERPEYARFHSFNLISSAGLESILSYFTLIYDFLFLQAYSKISKIKLCPH